MISEMAQKILEERYFVPGETTWEQLCHRVAKFVSGMELHGADHGVGIDEYKLYRDILTNQDFLPNSPCLMNAGTEHPMLFACFVIPIEDSIESIFDAIKTTALVQRRGGGTGFNFGKLRGRGERVASTNGESSGAVSFLKVFDAATEAISQGGKRRGASMGILPFDHPDIDEFLHVKAIEGSVKNFNLSVMVKDSDMSKLHTNYSGETGTDNATWKQIIDGMWQNGEPGVLFYDTINASNPTPHLGNLETTNPCVTGDTKILTRGGERRIDTCVDTEIDIWNGYEWSTVTPTITGRDQDVVIVWACRTSDCYTKYIACTPYHTFYTTIGKRHASELLPGDVIVPFYDSNDLDELVDDLVILGVFPTGKFDKVYCLTEPKNHTFVANGILTGNCGEAALLPFESCVLGSINLTKFVRSADGCYSEIDWIRLAEVARIATRFLDRCIDLNEYPIPEIEEATKRTRKIGLGVMGFADCLLMMDIAYDSDAGRSIGSKIMRTISEAANAESHKLAQTYGKYPAFEIMENHHIMRNAIRTTIAPTGTISLLAGVSWGIEPISSYSYLRKNCAGMEFMVGHPILEARLREYGSFEQFHIDAIMDRCYQNGSIQNDNTIPKHLTDVFVTATDIDAKSHILMQAAFQEHTDNAISKTIICPEDTTREQIAEIIYNAWNAGCKGLTVYRNNSRKDVVVNLKEPSITDTDIKVSRSTDILTADAPVAKSSDSIGNVEHSHKRPRKLYGCTYKIHSGCGNLYVVTNLGVDGKVRESFVFTGGAGGCSSLNEALGRATSQGLWNGVSIDNYVRQFCKVKCAAAMKNPKSEGKSCADIMGKCLAETNEDKLLRLFALGELSPDSEFYKRMNLQKTIPLSVLHSPESNNPRCAECDSQVVQTGQCYTCQSCGFSKCG